MTYQVECCATDIECSPKSWSFLHDYAEYDRKDGDTKKGDHEKNTRMGVRNMESFDEQIVEIVHEGSQADLCDKASQH